MKRLESREKYGKNVSNNFIYLKEKAESAR